MGVYVPKREPNYEELRKRRALLTVEIEEAVRTGSVPNISGELEAFEIARAGDWEVDALMNQMAMQDASTPERRSFLTPQFKVLPTQSTSPTS